MKQYHFQTPKIFKDEGNVYLVMHTFYLYGARHIANDHSDHCHHHYMGYSFQLAARGLLYAPSHTE